MSPRGTTAIWRPGSHSQHEEGDGAGRHRLLGLEAPPEPLLHQPSSALSGLPKWGLLNLCLSHCGSGFLLPADKCTPNRNSLWLSESVKTTSLRREKRKETEGQTEPETDETASQGFTSLYRHP